MEKSNGKANQGAGAVSGSVGGGERPFQRAGLNRRLGRGAWVQGGANPDLRRGSFRFYEDAFDAFAPADLHRNPAARKEWAIDQMMKAAVASSKLGLSHTVSFTGSSAFPFLDPWTQRPAGLIEEAFAELGRRWTRIARGHPEGYLEGFAWFYSDAADLI